MVALVEVVQDVVGYLGLAEVQGVAECQGVVEYLDAAGYQDVAEYQGAVEYPSVAEDLDVVGNLDAVGYDLEPAVLQKHRLAHAADVVPLYLTSTDHAYRSCSSQVLTHH